MYTHDVIETGRRLNGGIKFHALLYNGKRPELSIYIEYAPKKNEIYCGGCYTIETMTSVPKLKSKRIALPVTYDSIDELVKTIGQDQIPKTTLYYLKKIAKSVGETLPN